MIRTWPVSRLCDWRQSYLPANWPGDRPFRRLHADETRLVVNLTAALDDAREMTMKKRLTKHSIHTLREASQITFSGFRPAVVLLCLIALGIGITLLRSEFGRVDASALTQESKVSQDGLWTSVDETLLKLRQEERTLPQAYKTVQLNQNGLMRTMNQAPMELTEQAGKLEVLMSLPMPDGTFSKFRIEESPILEPKLAASLPQFKTYQGQGIDDPEATMRFDWTPTGFHAIVFSAKGTIYVDPYSTESVDHYITYYKADYQREVEPFKCLVSEAKSAKPASPPPLRQGLGTGWSLRTYRLALAATGEYTSFFRRSGDSDSDAKLRAFGGIFTTMNRVNGIYVRELGIAMRLVDQEMDIIYTDPATDPYMDDLLKENQENLDQVLSPCNYDIGHVFTLGGGGVAYLGVVCVDGAKAGGVTGGDRPKGDGFDVDYVAHEMGHQFGANHTFNAAHDQRAPDAAYEPGSASTIMGYAGLFGAQDLQRHSDDYFHSKSLEEIIAHINTTPRCAEGCGYCSIVPPRPNTAPWVSATPIIVIPKNTPFTLDASGGDPNGDPVTFCWEEYDLGPPSPPDTDADGMPRPILRSFRPTSSNSRTFPRLLDILTTPTFGESLPTIARTMNFQVTVRDNRGGLASAMTEVKVTPFGPFVVTFPNLATDVLPVNTKQVVSWDVAGTSVIANKVSILLSTDAGASFPILLASGVPNTGVALVTLPNTPTNNARIKVQADGRNFFDISNEDFKIADFQGFLDSANCDTVSGWAWNSAQTNNPINVDIYDGPFRVATVLANQFRQDLVNAGIGNGFHGYTFTFPYRLVDRQTHPISVKFSGTNINLINSPSSVGCGVLFKGYLDEANCDVIYGWAWDVNRPASSVNVDLYDNGHLFTTVAANLFRPDLAPAGIGNGYHAFQISVPSRLKDGRSHLISATISGLSIPLINSPKQVLCSP